MQDDLTTLKDDMTAFIVGHGLRRFHGYVSEDVPSVMWDSSENPDAWKDLVELAKASGSPFVTMSDVVLDKEDLDFLTERLNSAAYPDDEDLEEARWLKSFVGKTGFIQIGLPYQGIMFLFEASTDWYDRYQRLVDLAEELGGFVIDEPDTDEEE